MQVPNSVITLLDTQKVNYSVTDCSNNLDIKLVSKDNTTSLVKSLLVEDGKGQAQIIIPADGIVDMDSMFRQFGRRFSGVSAERLRPIINKEGMESLPAIPNWQGLETYIDTSLLKKEKLFLESGTPDQILEMSRDDFGEMITTAKVGKFTHRAPALSTDPADDEAMITSAVDKFTEKRIRQRLEETLEMPPLPETAQRIIKLRADPNADISDLTNIVEIDPSLAAQVVSWAASPYYSAPGKIKSVHDAIVRVLGFDMVLNLALGLALGKTLTMKAISREQINDYWRNAVYTAATVEGLVTSISREHRPGFGMTYLSGLLNNFGYLVMAEVFPPYFSNINNSLESNPHLPNATIEQHLLGISSNQIASWLLDNWSMPVEVVTAIRQQYNAAYDGEYAVYAKLNYVAREMLAEQGFGTTLGQPISDQMMKEIHLDPQTARTTVANILESGDDLDSIAEKMRG